MAQANGKENNKLPSRRTAVDKVVFWSAPAERSGDGALSRAGHPTRQVLSEPKRCRASLATALPNGLPGTFRRTFYWPCPDDESTTEYPCFFQARRCRTHPRHQRTVDGAMSFFTPMAAATNGKADPSADAAAKTARPSKKAPSGLSALVRDKKAQHSTLAKYRRKAGGMQVSHPATGPNCRAWRHRQATAQPSRLNPAGVESQSPGLARRQPWGTARQCPSTPPGLRPGGGKTTRQRTPPTATPSGSTARPSPLGSVPPLVRRMAPLHSRAPAEATRHLRSRLLSRVPEGADQMEARRRITCFGDDAAPRVTENHVIPIVLGMVGSQSQRTRTRTLN
jgi:hypothetical protein